MTFTTSTISAIALILGTASAQSIYEIASGNDSFSTLVSAIDAANLTGLLSSAGTYTVFAPTNDAFAALPDGTLERYLYPEWIYHLQDLLYYHGLGSVVLSTDLTDGMIATTANGENITIVLDPSPAVVSVDDETTANILVDQDLVDIVADNGVIHAVDGVLIPTSAGFTIVDIAGEVPQFSTLAAAITAADLNGVLSGEGPFTVFAPTDDAFAALPNGTLDSLLLPENKDALAKILSYHVLQGNVHSSTIIDDVNVTTLSGHDLHVHVSASASLEEGTVQLNNGAASVFFPDFLASNGIIHVIDAVLIPPEDDNVTTTTGTTEMPMTTATTTAAAAAASDGDDGETETDAMEMAATTTVAPGEPSGETEGDGGEEVVEDSSSATTHYFVAAFGVLVASSWSMLVL